MIRLTPEERDKFALWLEQEAHDQARLLEQLGSMPADPAIATLMTQRRAEMHAHKIVALVLRSTQTQTIG